MWGSQGWNQWALQPAMFNDVPHEQIDWAELAKQWIQMQQTHPSDVLPPAPPPPPPPPPPPQAPPSVTLGPPPPPGHTSILSEEFPDKKVPLKISVPSAVIPEPYHSKRSFESEPGAYLPKSSANNTFWGKSHWDAPGDMDDRLWGAQSAEPAASLLGGKETFDYGHMHDNPPLAMQSIDYNHMSEFSYNQVYPTPAPPPETHYDQYWSQVNAAPTISPIFLKKERASANLQVEEDSSQLDAAKRKQLPAWIRDGLEKMEQERLKRLEKDRAAKESAEIMAKTASLRKKLDLKDDDPSSISMPSKSKFESDSEEDEVEHEIVQEVKSPLVEKRPPSPIEEDLRSEEEKKQDLMLKVRRTLTEVLLSVTNSEMISIAQEMFRKAVSKAPARQLASSTSLTSVASGLRGLASYGTESEASDAEEDEAPDSEEELYHKIKEKKRLFAVKEKKIIADLEQKELEETIRIEKINNEKYFNKEFVNPEKLDNVTNNVNTFVRNSTSNNFIQPVEQASSKEISIKTEDLEENIYDETHVEMEGHERSKNPNIATKDESISSDSSSSSSDSESDSGEKLKKKVSKEDKKSKLETLKVSKKDKNSTKLNSRHKRSKSRDSGSSGKHRRERSHDRKNNYKKKKKYKRSESSSSSSSSRKKSKRSSKYELSHNHREHRSHSFDDRERKRKRSVSPSSRSHRKSDSHSSRSHRYEDEKREKRYKDEKRHREHRQSPSPSRHTKLPRKYRTSRSLSSESESSGKKSKKSRKR